MRSEDIKKQTWKTELWLKEIALQLALLNEKLDSVTLNVLGENEIRVKPR